MTKKVLIFLFLLNQNLIIAQNYSFDFNSSGRRVCLVSSQANLITNTIKIIFHDSLSNTTEQLSVNRRLYGTTSWNNAAPSIAAGTGSWIDNNVSLGEIWEYQVKRQNTWSYETVNYDAVGYTMGCLKSDNADYRGQMILLVSNDIPLNLSSKYYRLKKDITADGWFVNEVVVPRAAFWDSEGEVVTIKNQIATIYNNAPANDKPKSIFILGHVPLPRSGSTSVVAPDEHDENKGARGCDAYYADMDGIYTDIATYNPGGLSSPLNVNFPGDFKWDQDFFPSDIEMAFGRIDFASLTEVGSSEMILLENYMDRLSNYKNVATDSDMGDKSAFYSGYDNSNDGSYRSLLNISGPSKVYQSPNGVNHNQWVQNNGPFKIYMQNINVPEINDWQTYGMNATIFSSDQSYWGFADGPQPNGLDSRIRALLGYQSKCLVALWTTTGINIFHQACTGEALGESMRNIMNHNTVNQYLEKPPQQYDTQDWWNRSHFTFLGDPTLNLYQIKPPSNVTIAPNATNAILSWTNSTDPEVIGYHVFESSSEFGKFERISSTLIAGNSFFLSNYQSGKWYMVKAIRLITSGCGSFFHSSIGKEIRGDFNLNIDDNQNQVVIRLFPNPAKNNLQIETSGFFTNMEIYSIVGEKVVETTFTNNVDISMLNQGTYILKLHDGLNNVNCHLKFDKVY